MIQLSLAYVTGYMEERSQTLLPFCPRESFREIWPDVTLGFNLKVQNHVLALLSSQAAQSIFLLKSFSVLEFEPRKHTVPTFYQKDISPTLLLRDRVRLSYPSKP